MQLETARAAPWRPTFAQRLRIRWEHLAVVVWAAILIVCCTRALVRPNVKSVYPIFATAARHWVAGQELYDELGPGLDHFRYSPLVAAFLVPFSVLPDSLGATLWRLCNAAVYLAAFGWWVRAVLPATLTLPQRACLFLLIVPLSIGSLNNGQSNPLVLGLLLASIAAARTDRWNLSAACVGLACLFKVYPLAVGLLLAAAYPRRMTLRLTLAVAAGLALPFAMQDVIYVAGQYQSWLHHLLTYDRQNLAANLWYRDLRLLCRAWMVPLDHRAYLVTQLAAGAVMAVLCIAARRAGWPRARLLLLLFALACCWMTLLGPATESCTHILLAPTLAWALFDAWQTRRWSLPAVLIGGSYALFLACQLVVWFPIGRAVHTLGLQPLAVLFLLTAILLSTLHTLVAPIEPPCHLPA
jgi:hypothetical protein